jgi:hypothetical protein
VYMLYSCTFQGIIAPISARGDGLGLAAATAHMAKYESFRAIVRLSVVSNYFPFWANYHSHCPSCGDMAINHGENLMSILKSRRAALILVRSALRHSISPS